MRLSNKKFRSYFYFYLILSTLLVCLITQTVYATDHSDQTVKTKNNHAMLNGVGTGTLLMRNNKQDSYQVATLHSTQAKVSISGPIATTEISQSFNNTGLDFAESIYVFPLAENSAVKAMEIHIGERSIVGKIMEKKHAKRIYVQAKRQGKRAALLEQSRPNLFTTSVANIPAGETVTVILRFNQTLILQSDETSQVKHYEYRLPTTLTPRYQPIEQRLKNDNRATENTVEPDSTANHEIKNLEQAIFPPQVKQAGERVINPINIQVEMHEMNFDDEVRSLYQKIDQETVDRVRHLSFTKHSVSMDQDFVLRWTLNENTENRAQFFTETIEGEEYGLLVLSPPEPGQKTQSLPREVIFIIDSSGSMGGASMQQAKQSLIFALDNIAPHERFNIIDFDSSYTNLFTQPKEASQDNIRLAKNFVRKLSAGGGTEMARALRSALEMKADGNFLKQIVFITDGAVSNEQQLLTLLHEKMGNSRLFTVGIGSAPNSYFMRKAADFGRGSFTYIGSLHDVQPQMSELFAKIGSPLLQNIELEFPTGIDIEQWPQQIPDLYAGEALIVPVKFNHRPSWVTVKGLNNSIWVSTLTLDSSKQHPGVSSLWARKKIESLMDEMVRGQSEESIKPQIIDVALGHHLLSKFTSFVAVDESTVRKQDQKLASEKLANLQPKGHRYPGTASGLNLWYLFVLLSLSFAVIVRYRHIYVVSWIKR